MLTEYILQYFFYLWTFSHASEMTQWDHPEMAEILHSLGELIFIILKINFM